MGGKYGMHRRKQKPRRILIGKTKMKETTWQVLGADGRIILIRSLEQK
jgi:hypothetical protein